MRLSYFLSAGYYHFAVILESEYANPVVFYFVPAGVWIQLLSIRSQYHQMQNVNQGLPVPAFKIKGTMEPSRNFKKIVHCFSMQTQGYLILCWKFFN